LNGVTTVANGGTTIYFAKSVYPNLDKQIQVGNTVVGGTPTTTATVTGAVFTPDGDPDNWGVLISTTMDALTTVNFSGIRHTITNTGVVRTNDVPSFQSLQFNQPQGDFLSTPASADWNLGNNWTMEFWIKANNSSNAGINIPGGQWGLINQGGWYGGMPDDNCILVGMAGGNLTINQSANADIQFFEPTPGIWTHVAVVNNGGGSAQKVYYNGVEQSLIANNYTTIGKTNTTADLYIGRLSNQYAGYASHFDGKMAMVRISNTAKYAAAFTATTTYGVEADTVLFLDKVNPLSDASASDHNITNNGVATSTSFPNTFTGLVHPYGGGTFGTTYCLETDPRLAEATSIPIGARITSNIAGFGTRTVTGNQIDFNGGRTISYDQTGLTGNTSTSHVFNFYW
jgi:hypothetical protein